MSIYILKNLLFGGSWNIMFTSIIIVYERFMLWIIREL